MSVSTYTELVTALTNYTHRAGMTDRIPEFIAMAESHMNRKLRVKEMEASASITPSQTVRYVALPIGFMELISFSDNYGEPLTPIDAENLERAAYGIGAQKPYYFRITSRINFEAVANAVYSFSMNYWKRLDLAADLTNSVLTNHPDAYLYAALAQAALYAKDSNSASLYIGLRDGVIRDANNQAARSTQSMRAGLPIYSANILNDR